MNLRTNLKNNPFWVFLSICMTQFYFEILYIDCSIIIMVCYNWEVKFQGQHKLISWFPKININKDNKDNIIIYAWFKNILKGLRIRTFHGLKKWFFFFRERVRGEFGGHPPPGKLFFKNYIIKYPQKCTPCKHRYQSDPLHPDFFFIRAWNVMMLNKLFWTCISFLPFLIDLRYYQ